MICIIDFQYIRSCRLYIYYIARTALKSTIFPGFPRFSPCEIAERKAMEISKPLKDRGLESCSNFSPSSCHQITRSSDRNVNDFTKNMTIMTLTT